MNKNISDIRKRNLPWNGEGIVRNYLSTHPNFPYRDQFIKLILESYHSYLAGCPKASIIVAGEALLRVLYDQIIRAIKMDKEVRINNSVINNQSSVSELHELYINYTYHQTIQAIKASNLLPNELINEIYVVKDLRNLAVHGEFPVLNEYDPKSQTRSNTELETLLSVSSGIPEAYKFKVKSRQSYFEFEVENYKCNTLKDISIEDRFSVIQNSLVWKILAKINGTNHEI